MKTLVLTLGIVVLATSPHAETISPQDATVCRQKRNRWRARQRSSPRGVWQSDFHDMEDAIRIIHLQASSLPTTPANSQMSIR